MRLKAKNVVKPTKTIKVILPGEISLLIEHYQLYYQSVYQQEIPLPDLLADMAAAFLKSDREFLRWRRAHVEA